MPDNARDITMEVHVRSLARRGLQDPQERLVDRLRELAADGVIDEFTLSVWGDRLPVESPAAETEPGQRISERISTFRSWGERTDLDLRPAFETRTVDSQITGESYRTLVLPERVLAEYHGDTLAWVAPCTDGETVYTVSDRLEALADQAPGGEPDESVITSLTAGDDEDEDVEERRSVR